MTTDLFPHVNEFPFKTITTAQPPSYYNTTHLTGKALAEAREKCNEQEEAVLAFFEARREASPSQCWQQFEHSNVPITSIRRAITNLTERGLLVKTERTATGIYGKPEHVWRIAE